MGLLSLQRKLNKHYEKINKKIKCQFIYPARVSKDIADYEDFRFEKIDDRAMKSMTKIKFTKPLKKEK